MKTLHYILIFTIISCTKPVEIDLNEVLPKLVVNSLITSENNIEVNISKTSSILDTNTYYSGTPIVGLYENESFIGNLEINSNNNYEINYKPFVSKQYKLKIFDNQYGEVIAMDTIPKVVTISEATIIIPVGFNEDGSPYSEVTLKFEDSAGEQNFYEVCLYSIYSDEKRDYITEFSSTDPIILNEGNMDYYPTSLFFSDKLFSDETVEIKFKFVGLSEHQLDGSYSIGTNVYVILRSISHNYYLYRKYWTRHSYNQTLSEDAFGMLFNGEPIEMYTNISNGYGIFAAYNQDIKELTFIPQK